MEGYQSPPATENLPRWSFGVLNPRSAVDVPGTVCLLNNRPDQSQTTDQLLTTADGTIILSPQPSASPNDPLNWPRWRRDAALASLGLYCALGGGIPVMLAAGFTNIGSDYSVPVSRVALTTGLLLLGQGVGSALLGPTAIIYGKRPVYLATAALFIAASAWCALSPTFVSLLLARMVQGIALSPVEALPTATIADMYFLHERAFRVGLYAFMFLGGKNLIPLASAAVIEAMGWRWMFWIAVFSGAFCSILMFLFLHETFWDRTPAVVEGVRPPSAVDGRSSPKGHNCATSTPIDPETPPLASLPPFTPLRQSQPALPFTAHLRPHHGRLLPSSHTGWHHAFLRPFLLLAYPSILWSAAVYSFSVGWLIVLSETVAVVYRARERYGLTEFETGLVYLSPFVGGVLGTAVAGRISDVVAVRVMARRNAGGLYEPEFRLVMMIPVAICTGAGLIGFGWSAEEGDALAVPTVWFGIIAFGCALGSTTAMTFCVDSYREFAGEALVTLSFCKNILHGLVFSLFVTGWVEHDGPKKVFVWIGIMQLVVLAFTIPMFVFGKHARLWTASETFWLAKSAIFRR